MENKNKPVNPIVSQHGWPHEAVKESATIGLTKIEYFSVLIMAAAIGSPNLDTNNIQRIAGNCIEAAGVLLDELEKRK